MSLATRLPTVTCSRLTRPSMGAVMWVKSRLSLAASTAAWAVATCASPWFLLVADWSNSDLEVTLVAWRSSARAKLRLARSCAACACLSWPSAWSERGLVRTRVDDEEGVALLDQRAVLEGDLGDVAAHARTDLDILDGSQTARVFRVLDDLPCNRFGDRHRGRRGCRRRGLLFTSNYGQGTYRKRYEETREIAHDTGPS